MLSPGAVRQDDEKRRPDLSVVICHYDTQDLLRRCLVSLDESSDALTLECFVIDNASPGFSIGAWRAEFPHVVWLQNDSNVGFAAACNRGLHQARGRHVLLLNPDTSLMPRTLVEMIRFLDESSDVGAVTCRLERPDGTLDLACRRAFPTPSRALWHFLRLSRLFPRSRVFGAYNMTFCDEGELTEIDSPCGAFMMVRADILTQVGVLDETFWMYGEDLDWSMRIKAAGYRIFYNPRATAIHVKRAASSKVPFRARRAFFQSMRLFYKKHYRSSYPTWLGALVISGIRIAESAALCKLIIKSTMRTLQSARSSET